MYMSTHVYHVHMCICRHGSKEGIWGFPLKHFFQISFRFLAPPNKVLLATGTWEQGIWRSSRRGWAATGSTQFLVVYVILRDSD